MLLLLLLLSHPQLLQLLLALLQLLQGLLALGKPLLLRARPIALQFALLVANNTAVAPALASVMFALALVFAVAALVAVGNRDADAEACGHSLARSPPRRLLLSASVARARALVAGTCVTVVVIIIGAFDARAVVSVCVAAQVSVVLVVLLLRRQSRPRVLLGLAQAVLKRTQQPLLAAVLQRLASLLQLLLELELLIMERNRLMLLLLNRLTCKAV